MANQILAASLIAGIISAILALSWSPLVILKAFAIGFAITAASILIAKFFR